MGSVLSDVPSGEDYGQLMAQLVRTWDAAPDLPTVLSRVVSAAVVNVPGAQYAGVTVLTKNSVESPTYSDELVRAIDLAQYEVGQGPCLTAAADNADVVVVDDVRHDPRWPAFSARIANTPIESVLAFRLFTAQDTIGALNIFASTAHAFDDEAVRIGEALATHAAIAIGNSRVYSNMTYALANRDRIGQAKGILMERYQLTEEQAFDLLIAASQETNRKLRDIAHDLTITRQLPQR